MVGTVGRLFLAVDLSLEARSALVARLEGALDRMPGRAVPPPNWHLTLRFLGDVTEVAYDRLVHGIGKADLGAGFGVTFGELGAFPRPRRATVLWLGVEGGDDRLKLLAHRVEEAVKDSGFPAEDRPFRSHLTLSRIRPPEDVSALLDGGERVGVRAEVDALTLFRSNLGRGGATYEVLDRFPLGANG